MGRRAAPREQAGVASRIASRADAATTQPEDSHAPTGRARTEDAIREARIPGADAGANADERTPVEAESEAMVVRG